MLLKHDNNVQLDQLLYHCCHIAQQNSLKKQTAIEHCDSVLQQFYSSSIAAQHSLQLLLCISNTVCNINTLIYTQKVQLKIFMFITQLHIHFSMFTNHRTLHTQYMQQRSLVVKRPWYIQLYYCISLFTVPLHIENPLNDIVIKSLTHTTINGRKILHTWEEMEGLVFESVSWAYSQQQLYFQVTPAFFHSVLDASMVREV